MRHTIYFDAVMTGLPVSPTVTDFQCTWLSYIFFKSISSNLSQWSIIGLKYSISRRNTAIYHLPTTMFYAFCFKSVSYQSENHFIS